VEPTEPGVTVPATTEPTPAATTTTTITTTEAYLDLENTNTNGNDTYDSVICNITGRNKKLFLLKLNRKVRKTSWKQQINRLSLVTVAHTAEGFTTTQLEGRQVSEAIWDPQDHQVQKCLIAGGADRG